MRSLFKGLISCNWDVSLGQKTYSAHQLMELEFNGSRLRARYTKVWNPPVRGGEHDRVKRQESYVKDFKPFKMGRIKLKKGRGPLRFKAMDLPGNKAPEFRLMELIRITD